MKVCSQAYGQASGQPIGYFQTSAIDRYLREKGLSEQIDIFIIDTSIFGTIEPDDFTEPIILLCQ